MKLPLLTYILLRSRFLWCFISAIVFGIFTTDTRGQSVSYQQERGSLNNSLFSEPSSILGSPTLLSWYSAPKMASSEPIGPITTDRPDFTEASSTVGANVAQLEMGYTFTHDNESIATGSHSTPEALFRIGTPINWLELRLAANRLQENTGSVSHGGAEDLYLGVKLGLTAQDGMLPEMALVPQMTVPTGGSVFTNHQVLPGVNWLYGWDVTDCLTTAGSTQFNHAVDSGTGTGYTEWAQSWTVGYSLHDRVGMYTEWYALMPDNAATAQVEHYGNGGFTFLLNDDIQWDIRAGVGLNDAADDYFLGTGLSIRFRKR